MAGSFGRGAAVREPSSELHIAEDWYRRTALEDRIGLPASAVNDDRLYLALDRLLPHKVALDRHLRARLGNRLRSTTTCCCTT